MHLICILSEKSKALDYVSFSEKKSDVKMQLIGAMGLMFLIGTPWIFSALGALSTNKSGDTQLSFQDGIIEVILFFV